MNVVDKSSSVIIVGNSPSVLSEEYGSVIDSYDIVIRVNKCVTRGYEKFIGKKTDIWATTKTNNYGSKDFVPDNYQKLRGLWLRSTRLAKGKKPNHRMIHLPEDFPDISHHIMYKTKESKKAFTPILKIYGLDNPHEPCTGLLTILTSLLFYEDITVHGFTFYTEQQDKRATAYYRENELGDSEKHPEDELWQKNRESGFASQEKGRKKLKLLKALINHEAVLKNIAVGQNMIHDGKPIKILNPDELRTDEHSYVW